MRSRRSTTTPTRAQQARMDTISEVGCLIALIRGHGWTPCEIHHLNQGGQRGGKRRGHDFTIGLNPWSHRGKPFNGLSEAKCRELFGPPWQQEAPDFRELFGDDDTLLEIQNKAIEAFRAATRMPWEQVA